ncbi:MAG: ornithine cyclodeaminase family protein [Deltaproteobacteria bacterium]|nr:ornithine cyclodeaminase family protein [Deltaproteobacteria bacterium]
MKTLIITKKEVAEVLTPAVAIATVEKAFRAYGMGHVEMPAKSYLTFPKGDLRSMPAYIHGQGFDIAGIKSVNVHVANKGKYGLPTVMAVIILTDPETGFPLAIMDGTYLTSMRTGAAGATAVKLLSRKNAASAGFVGCGVQARTQLACAIEVRKLKTIKIWTAPDEKLARAFATWARRTYKLETFLSNAIDDVTTNVNILFTTTPSRTPLVNAVSPGTHINAIGADAEGKQELNPKIFKGATVVIDDWSQASHSGEINVPLRKRQISKKTIYGELGEIAAKKKKGRTSAGEITIFDSTGLAIQDISCAFVVYNELKGKRGVRKVALF